MIRVEIDPHSGFCPGVIRAIGCAEDYLQSHSKLYSLGDIVHNEAELERLGSLGLVPLDLDDLDEIESAKGETVLIRAHGQPPRTYERLTELGFNIIDCSCPVVLSIQKSIRQAEGQVLIFGKRGHPEVLGLVGQTDGAVVFENVDQLREILPSVKAPVELFSQTTMSPVEYDIACSMLQEAVPQAVVHKTICAQVKNRHQELQDFARKHSVIVFVSGKNSSNGKVLSGVCRQVNIRTFHISDISELKREYFSDGDSVGVCGATSTPRWLLEQVAAHIEKM